MTKKQIAMRKCLINRELKHNLRWLQANLKILPGNCTRTYQH
jgi:hypothetical protein